MDGCGRQNEGSFSFLDYVAGVVYVLFESY